ncbi:MAG TPA: CaiB/BaiF CoA-transferase family protein [Candidatus Bathyarchaeia archaeon]|nr:CaiB/BaiF CoA-transferase family protein [Candidatus Bathyarchaeia archaeon]
MAAGHYASTAILASLARKLVTGRGEYIDLALYDSIVSWLTYLASYYSATGKEPEKMGSAHPSIVPYQAFKCRDRYLVVAVGNDSQWKSFYTVLDLENILGNKRYSTNPGRVRHRQVLIPLISRRLRSKTASHWLRAFEKNNVPCALVKSVSETIRDPQIKARQMLLSSKPGFPRIGSPYEIQDNEKRESQLVTISRPAHSSGSS